MVSGSQLQVAKLAQMRPAAPSGAQQCPAALSSAQRRPAATRIKTRVKTTIRAQRHRTVPTSAFLEHIIHLRPFLKKRRVMTPHHPHHHPHKTGI